MSVLSWFLDWAEPKPVPTSACAQPEQQSAPLFSVEVLVKCKENLRQTTTNPPKTFFEHRHPVLRQLAAGDYTLRPVRPKSHTTDTGVRLTRA